MHPRHLAGPVVEALITAHPSAQEISEQQLVGEGQGL
jgi:hypothetical protein